MPMLTCKANSSQEGEVVPLKEGDKGITCKMSRSCVRVLAGETGIAFAVLPNIGGFCNNSRLTDISALTSRHTWMQ